MEHPGLLTDEQKARNERRGLFYSIIIPFVFVAVLWFVKIVEVMAGADFTHFGLLPRSPQGIAGIFTGPLIHSDLTHLFSNSVPLVALGIIMMMFYRQIAFQVFWWIYFMTGLWVWAAGRQMIEGHAIYHIGASGIVYGLVCFIFFSGIFRWDLRLLRPSLLVLVFYGGMIWGVLPGQQAISWESHALGSLAGIITAFYFRKDGPKKKEYKWEDEDENDITEQPWNDPSLIENDKKEDTTHPLPGTLIHYIYIRQPQQPAPPREENRGTGSSSA
jgi:membrane associated rhomboid family serine protease